jgi:hypothetical protein
MNASAIKLAIPFIGILLLGACASGPKPLDWQLEAKGAMERSVAAYMEGNSRVERVEFECAQPARAHRPRRAAGQRRAAALRHPRGQPGV